MIPVAGLIVGIFYRTRFGSLFVQVIGHTQIAGGTHVVYHVRTQYSTQLQSVNKAEFGIYVSIQVVVAILVATTGFQRAQWIKFTQHIVQQVSSICRFHFVVIVGWYTGSIHLQASTGGTYAVVTCIGQDSIQLQAAHFSGNVSTEVIALHTKITVSHIITLLVIIAQRHHVSSLVTTSRYTQIVVLLKSRAHNLVEKPALLVLMGSQVTNLVGRILGSFSRIGGSQVA